MAIRHYREEQQAIALLQWVRTYQRRFPELGLLFSIPNGGRRNPREAARLKAQGVRAGVSDYMLPVSQPAGWASNPADLHGLWLELKADGGKPTPSQSEWIRLMREQGYAAEVCTGWVAAARCIASYLGLPDGVAP